MKILLLSLLAITMIGLTVPNAFADHIKNEIPIDVFKLTEDELNEMPRIWYNPNTSSWEENIWTDTKYELKTESKVPTSIAGAESRLMQTFSGITIQDRILEFKIRYTEFNSQNSAIEYFDLILLDGGPAIALNKDWELVHLPKGSGSDCKSVDYPQGQKFGPKGVCHIGNYVMEFSMSMKGDVVEPVSETNFIIAMLLEDRYSLMTKSVILEKEQMTMEPESQFSLQQQKNDQELDRTETGNGITIDVYQEKSSYEFGDPILLKFQVSKFIPNTPLEFQIFRDGVQPQHGLGGCGAVKTNSMSLDNNGIAYYRFDTFDSQGLNKAANAYACKIEDHGPATYFVNVYYGAQWNFSGGKPNIGIPTDYLASAKTSFTFSNEYSSEAKKLIKIFPTKMDIGTVYNFDERFGLSMPHQFGNKFFKERVQQYELPSPEINLSKNYGKLKIKIMEFEEKSNAQKYKNSVSSAMPASGVSFVGDSSKDSWTESGYDCLKARSWYFSADDVEIICQKDRMVFSIFEKGNAGGLQPAYKSIIEKLENSEYMKSNYEEKETIVNSNSDSPSPSSEGGGCLIATAAFGSEMAPQVQFLRELRDNTVMSTQSGTAFMTGFNQFYYSFSPQIADYERENPVFKEAVKVTLTPLLTSLTLLNYVEIDSEEEMLGYGIGTILLNVGMYFVAPAVLVIALKNRLKK